MSERAGCMVAIDGPAGAGKSTIAREVAERTGFTYIDTGAMYRAVALHVLREGLDVEKDADAVGDLAGRLRFEFREVDDDPHLFVDGEDVERAVRTSEVGNLSSPVSAIPEVREHLVAAQRRMAEREPVVMEGRDIGTVVFPDALLKIFLTASAEERARRRYEQRIEQGEAADYEQILADQRVRDQRDRTREIAPLRRAEDAVEVDSDPLTVEEVVRRVMELLEDRLEEHDGWVV
ncbi:MAG: (d)CMP kinase [Armatimonadota bacterium]